MRYYLHDTSAFDDEKITELFLKFGYKGLGLFYTALEKIAKQEKPIKTDILKSQLKIDKRLEKCWQFMEGIGLIVSSNGESFNEKLMNYSHLYDIRKLSTKKRVAEWRERQKDTKNVTRYERVSNAPKVKESKVNESKFFKSEKVDSLFKIFIQEQKESVSDERTAVLVEHLEKLATNDDMKMAIIQQAIAGNHKDFRPLPLEKQGGGHGTQILHESRDLDYREPQPPPIEEVIKFFTENGQPEDKAREAYQTYDKWGWLGKRGDNMVSVLPNWKESMFKTYLANG